MIDDGAGQPDRHPLEALRRWATSSSPAADLALVVRHNSRPDVVAVRRRDTTWLPLDLPPVPAPAIATAAQRLELARERPEACHDLLYALGMQFALCLPLSRSRAAMVVLARAEAPFSDSDAATEGRRAAALGRALAVMQRPGGTAAGPTPSAEEVGALFELTRDLGNALSPAEAAGVALQGIVRLLTPSACAVVLRPGVEAATEVATWPDGPVGHDALRRALGERPNARTPLDLGARGAPGWTWEKLPLGKTRVGLAAGWRAGAPARSRPILSAVYASLALAADRLATQQRIEENRLRAIVEGFPRGVILAAEDGRVRISNPAARQLLEAAGAWPLPEERLTALGGVDLRPRLRAAVGGEASRLELRFAGGDLTFEVRISGVRPAAAEEDPQALVVVEDVTALRRSQAQLAQAEKLSAIGLFTAGVMHDVNTPLATVLGYTQLLLESPDAEQRLEWLQFMEQETQRCRRLIGNLLTYSRAGAQEREPIMLSTVADRALDLMSRPFGAAGIAVVLRVNPAAPPVEVDADALLRALVNLLTNALHALEQHAGERRVEIEIDMLSGGRVALRVRDSGPGIPTEHLGRLFDPFFTTKPAGQGTGLGLSLVADMALAHGGTAEVESAVGHGATFTITLPSAPSVPDPGASPVRAASAARPQLAGLDGLRVAVVDDEGTVAEMLAEVLREAGAQAEVWTDPEAAIDALSRSTPDVVICDWNMPAMNGGEFLRALIDRAPQLEGRVLFATGELLGTESAPVRRLGRPCIAKPFDLSHVLRQVKTLSGRLAGPGPA